MFAKFHREDFPLITIEFTGEKETPENFAEYLQELEQNYQAQKPFVLLFDAQKSLSLNVKYQLQQAKWMKDNESLIKTYCKAVAYLISNDILRNILKLIFKIQKNPVPFEVFENLPAAKNWLDGKMLAK